MICTLPQLHTRFQVTKGTHVFLTTFMCVYVCDMWGSFKHGALGRKPSCSGLRGVLTKEVYEFQSHWIFFRGPWEAHPCCTKSFHRWAVEAGTNVTPRQKGAGGLAPWWFGWRKERAVNVGMGGSKDEGKVIWRYNGSWEGFHKNKLSPRIVIVPMNISRFKAYGMFHGLFFLYQYVSRILQITWLLS